MTAPADLKASPADLRVTVRGEIPCRVYDHNLWFAEAPVDAATAKALCRLCSVREPCLAGAVERGEPWGVWGGEFFRDGVIVACKRSAGRPSKDAAAREAALQREVRARTQRLLAARRLTAPPKAA